MTIKNGSTLNVGSFTVEAGGIIEVVGGDGKTLTFTANERMWVDVNANKVYTDGGTKTYSSNTAGYGGLLIYASIDGIVTMKETSNS